MDERKRKIEKERETQRIIGSKKETRRKERRRGARRVGRRRDGRERGARRRRDPPREEIQLGFYIPDLPLYVRRATCVPVIVSDPGMPLGVSERRGHRLITRKTRFNNLLSLPPFPSLSLSPLPFLCNPILGCASIHEAILSGASRSPCLFQTHGER